MIDVEVTDGKNAVRILANILDDLWIQQANKAYIPKIKISNKETNKIKLVTPYAYYLEHTKESVNLLFQHSTDATDEDLTNSAASTNGGCVQFGTNDFPYGLYELTVHYQTSGSSNHSDNFKKCYFEHLMVSPLLTADKEVEWKDYKSIYRNDPNETYITY